MTSNTRMMCESLLQDGVSSALAALTAIEGAGLLNALPANQSDSDRHNHGLALLAMLEDHLRHIQQQVDALSGITPAAQAEDR